MIPTIAAIGGMLLGLTAATWWWRRQFSRQDHTVEWQGERIDELTTLAERAVTAGEESQRQLAALRASGLGISLETMLRLIDVDEPMRKLILARAAANLEALVKEHTR